MDHITWKGYSLFLEVPPISFSTECYKKMKHIQHDLAPTQAVLTRFNGEPSYTVGQINLEVNIAAICTFTQFLIERSTSAYNVILGRPWIHLMWPWSPPINKKSRNRQSDQGPWRSNDWVSVSQNGIADPFWKHACSRKLLLTLQ